MTSSLGDRSPRLIRILVAAAAIIAAAAADDSRALTARMLSPVPMQKARFGEPVAVSIEVSESVGDPSWDVDLLDADGNVVRSLATGVGPLNSTSSPVAVVEPKGLDAGVLYRVRLRARDSLEERVADTTFRVVESAYQIIPMREGNLSVTQFGTFFGNGSGDQLFIGTDTDALERVERKTGRRSTVDIDLGASNGVALSSDSSILYYKGSFVTGGGTYKLGIGYQILNSGELGFVRKRTDAVFSVNDDGTRMAYTAADDAVESLQYFLYDRVSGESTQLTNWPDAVDPGSRRPCTDPETARPRISGDGQTVALLTSSTLGLVPPEPGDPCRLFVYSAEESEWRLAHTFSPSVKLFVPGLTADAGFISFILIEALPDGSRRGGPAGFDLRSGELVDPLVDVGKNTSFDASVTRMGNGVVFSSTADMDPRVGNADRNLELFFFDRETGDVEQITETTGGVGIPSNGCFSYEPYVNNDGSVELFGFNRLSVEGCQLVGIQREEATGFAYRMVRAVRKREGNSLAEFAPIADLRVAAGETLRLDLAASDPDGDPISFFVQPKGESDVPKGSVVVDNHDGTGSFEWATRLEDAGEYEFRVGAFDEGGGVVLRDFTISVLPSAAPTPTLADPAQPGGGDAACCGGDCDSDGLVTVAELIGMVRMSLAGTADDTCRCRGIGDTQPIGVADILEGVRNLFEGCP